MDHKAAETTRNINSTLGSEIASEQYVQWCFKKFCKGDESLEDEERSGSRQKLTTTSGEPSSSWSSYSYWRCQRTQHQPLYGHSAFEANWKAEKAQ